MECVRASGAPRRQLQAARNDSRGVFVNSKSRAGSTKKNEINISFHAGEASMIGGHMTDEKSDFTKECAVLQAGVFWSVLGTSYPQKLWRKKITSPLAQALILILSQWAKKKVKKKGKKSCGFLQLFRSIFFSEILKYASSLQIPCSISKSFVYHGETPTRARLLNDRFLRDPPVALK